MLGVCELKFLSFIVSGSRVKSDPNKIKLLQDLPYPGNLKQLQSLLESFNYFNHFIKDYALLVAPLYRLTRKQRKFEITDADKTIIDELKKKLLTQVEPVHYNPLKEIKLSVDASYYAIWGMLLQKEKINETEEWWLPISYFGYILKRYQLVYTITEKECLAVVIGVTKFKHFLKGKKFTIQTDHHALCQLKEFNFTLARLYRWPIILSALDYEFEYNAGNKHPSDCFIWFPSEWYHWNTESFDEEVLDSDTFYYSELARDELITGLKIKFEEQSERYTAPQRRMVLVIHQLLNTTPSTSRSIEYQRRILIA